MLTSPRLQPAFTIVATTTSGGQWLSVTPSSGTTPATLTFTSNTAGLKGSGYDGAVDIQGPANTLHVSVPADRSSRSSLREKERPGRLAVLEV